MAKLLPYFKWYPADAEGDDFYSLTLTNEELGIYHRLLNRSWLNDGITSDLDVLAVFSRLNRDKFDEVWKKISKRWVVSPRDISKLVNPRQEEERESARAKSENNKRDGNANAKGSRFKRVAIDSIRAYESESESPSEEVRVPTQIPKRSEGAPPWDEVNEAWKWYQAEYPGDVNPFIDLRLFLSVMETPEDLADLRSNLPLYKLTQKWVEGFFPSSENFISKRVFKIRPKARDSPAGYKRPELFDPVKAGIIEPGTARR